MIEITNKLKSPIQLLIKSRTKSRSFTCLNVPGIGKGKNVYLLEDERITDQIYWAEKKKFITLKKIPNNFN